MCTNYRPSARQELQDQFAARLAALPPDASWPEEAYQDYLAPIILPTDDGGRTAVLAGYSMVPKQHIPAGVKRYSTMNARAETIGQLRSYASAWKKAQLCLVPMQCFYEPNWESGQHERWRIGLADRRDFAVAGLWRDWQEQDGTTSHAFTQLTINADVHPLMRKFHKPEDEKRSLVIVAPDEYDAWLQCRDPELARSFLHLPPSELMAASPAPKPPIKRAEKRPAQASNRTADLF
jgi:putative SOS response-associated peptidase YedK